MNIKNPYFNMIKDNAIQVITITMSIIILQDIMYLFMLNATYKMRDEIIYSTQSYTMAFTMSVVFSVLCTLVIFNGAMRIRADRKSYLKAVIQWIIIMSIVLSVLGILIDTGYEYLLESIHNKNVIIYNIASIQTNEQIMANETGILVEIISRIFTCIFAGSIGFALSSLWYRLKKRTNILVFIIMPILFIALMVNIELTSPQIIESILYNISIIIEILTSNIIILSITKLSIAMISLFIGCKLLIKAPIKEYANDLL